MKSYTTLIAPEDLRAHLDDPDWATVDCRFSLADPPAGHRAYREGHIPGALYANLDDDLSGPVSRGKTGRHPLPAVDVLAAKLSAWGIDEAVQVVAYDDSGGSMAARFWWLLKWLGHERVAVLDGAWAAWLAAGGPVSTAVGHGKARVFRPRVRPELSLTADDVDRARNDPGWRVCDARAAERYRGENETIDPVAGHIPGACSLPYAENLGPDGRFRSVKELRSRYSEALGDVPVERAVCYCGSGVTAAHDLLAIAHAGLGEARLYPGSWSEWITDPKRPVETGDRGR
ncbi:MAG: sulfurtransferase [Gemmatimonadetes bacterium]|nr:sulfurtransferase [Gemmatimonadota bacterium]